MRYFLKFKARVHGSSRWKLGLAAILWVLVIVAAALLFRELPWTPNGDYRDFDTYYIPAEMLRRGINPYLGSSRWGDTPTWLLCFEALTLLPRYVAYKLWFFVNVAALTASLILLLGGDRIDRTKQWIVAALILIISADRAELLVWTKRSVSAFPAGVLHS